MNYIGKEVIHKTKIGKGLGHGVITNQESSYVFVKFDSNEERQFPYPDCFSSFLHLLDPEAEHEAKVDLQTKIHENEEKAAQKRAEINASISNYANEPYSVKTSKRKVRQINVPLYSSVQEFCLDQKKLLAKEISVLKEDGGKKIKITDGKLVERRGNNYIYSFESEVEVNVPDNTQISLWLPKQEEPISAHIVNSEEFSIIISSDQNIGNNISSISFTAQAWFLLNSLSERLDSFQEELSPIVDELVCGGKKRIQHNRKLNKGQEKACEMSLSQPISFIWGPPGTGKTETLSKIALSHMEKGYRVLMVSYSNVSVDGAVLRVFKNDRNKKPGKIVRYGYPKDKRVINHEYLYSYSLTLKSHPELIKERDSLIKERNTLTREKSRFVEIGERLSRIRELLRLEERESVKKATFVATTISKAVADTIIYKGSFDTVIVDEASMSYIPQIVFAAGLSTKHFICMGDFSQLPPIVQSDSTNSLNADIFNYCGIVEAVEKGVGHDWLCMLDTQYRMHPEIAGFSSKHMYHGLLKSAEKMAQERKAVAESSPLEGKALSLVDLSGMLSACRKTADQSRINVLSGFVSMALAAVASENNEVGIITPYRAQSSLMNAMRRDIMDYTKGENKITCATVHQFQGSEKDVIIYDAVDCYRMQYPGTLLSSTNNNYANRLYNVAMTRAKGKLVSVVNVDYMKKKNLSQNLIFRKMIDSFTNNNQQTAFSSVSLNLNNKAFAMLNAQEAKQVYLRDLRNAKKQVNIDVPQGMYDGDSEFNSQVADSFKRLKKHGVKLFVRTDNKARIPERIKPFVIENSYITDPITVIDNKLTWYGMLPSIAKFVSENKEIKINCRPIFRFEGNRFAQSIYGMLSMNNTIDSPRIFPDTQTEEEGHYNTFSAYVSGEVRCEKCGKPMKLKRKNSFFLACSGFPECHHTEWVTEEIVNKYLGLYGKYGKRCPQDGTSLEAKKGKYGIYVQCNNGLERHFYKLNEI